MRRQVKDGRTRLCVVGAPPDSHRHRHIYMHIHIYITHNKFTLALLGKVENEDAAVVAADREEVRELGVEVQGHDARLCFFGIVSFGVSWSDCVGGVGC